MQNSDWAGQTRILVNVAARKAAENLTKRFKVFIKNKREWNPGPYRRETGIKTEDTIRVEYNPDGGFSIVSDAPHIDALIEGQKEHDITAAPGSMLAFPVLAGGLPQLFQTRVDLTKYVRGALSGKKKKAAQVTTQVIFRKIVHHKEVPEGTFFDLAIEEFLAEFRDTFERE